MEEIEDTEWKEPENLVRTQLLGCELVQCKRDSFEPEYRVMLLPGYTCSDITYWNVMNHKSCTQLSIEFTAVNLPGFAGVPAGGDVDITIEGYAAIVDKLCHSLSNEGKAFDMIIGHSLTANCLIDVAKSGEYCGIIMLVSPSLFLKAEDIAARFIAGIMSKMQCCMPCCMSLSNKGYETLMGDYIRNSKVKPKLMPLMAKDARKGDKKLTGQQLVNLFAYIDGYSNLAPVIEGASKQVIYVRGEYDYVKFPDSIRSVLENSSHVTVVDIPFSGHFPMIDNTDAFLDCCYNALCDHRNPSTSNTGGGISAIADGKSSNAI